ncbi:adenine deaminase [Scopulibacillus cellulosilyticus]|uniref:Adenine deaminase n=1 Tax=Scopulibacillus cellulosilyticus TaxID=2665665 RepID=A0ABW2PSB3_9BACL
MNIDLFIKNVKVYNHSFKKFIQGNVAISAGKFFYIGKKDMNAFEPKEVIDGKGRFMIPGLIDIHLHIESTMVTPSTFSYGIIKNGVTTIVAEPHEMANVFGIRGIQEMIDKSDHCTADILYGIPSSVPATQFETTGGAIDIMEIDELAKNESVACLGEIMDYMDVITKPDCKTNRIVRHVKNNYPHLPIEGHCPKLMDEDLSRFIFAGIDSDHTHQTIEGMEERIRLGMFIEIQEKSMTPEIIQHLVEHDYGEHFCFVTDDVMPDSFVDQGHLNHIVRKAIKMGMKPEDAIYASTVTPAKRMRLYDRGMIAPNKIADFLLVNDIQSLDIDQVFKNGIKVYDYKEKYEQEFQSKQFPADFYESIKLAPLNTEDLNIKAPVNNGNVSCRIMTISDGSTFTKEKIADLQVINSQLDWENSPFCLIGVFERYGINGNKALGLVGGDTIKRGAIATTYSHDNHNLLVVGKNKEDIILAANTVIENQGGYCVVENGKVLSFLKLPVGGILSEEPLEQIAAEMKKLRQAMKGLGYKHYNPIMSFSTQSLPVSPELKITDLGLVKVNESKVVDLFV